VREVVLSDGTRLNDDSETSKFAGDRERRNGVGDNIALVRNGFEDVRRLDEWR
jgi:hypothetical protein